MQGQTHLCSPLRNIICAKHTPSGLEAVLDGDSQLRLDVLRNDVLRLEITHGGRPFRSTQSFAVEHGPEFEAADFEIIEDAESVRLQTRAAIVTLQRSPFQIEVRRLDGSPIIEGRSSEQDLPAYSYLNDEFMVTRGLGREDVILGLGERSGRGNRNGQSYTLWNTDILCSDATAPFRAALDPCDPRADPKSTEFDPYYMSIPFFMHLSHDTGKAAAFFVDNSSKARFEFQNDGWYRYQFDSGAYVEYIFAGPRISDIVRAYTSLVGRMPVPPLWALGYHQCRWLAYTQKTIEGLAAKFEELKLPCDSLWLDIEHMDGYRVFTWNKKAFPDPKGMMSSLKERGFNMVTIVDPGVKAEPGYPIYEEGAELGAFCRTDEGRIYTGQVWPGLSAFPDFVAEHAREWWAKQTSKLTDVGVAGIWNDMNEPATGEVAEAGMRFDSGRAPHGKHHNEYALLMAKATRQGLLAANPDQRPFILSRAGSAGIQRYAANWMGDNMSRWDHLQMSIPMALGLGLSGQPFVGADIGGFAEDCNAELFTRWMQCAALTPFCRNHNHLGCADQYPWSFGEAVADICRKSLELRYRLMPALYSTFVQSAESGLPVQRALLLDYQDDPTTWEIDDQFVVGDWLMVAPVLTQGCVARHVYLPRGAWHQWHTGELFTGPAWTTAQTPLDTIPLFARGGAVVPMWPEAPRSTAGYFPKSIELHVFVPTEDGEHRSVLIEDDGATFARDRGAYVRTELGFRRTGAYAALEGSVTGNGFPEMRRGEFALIFHGSQPGQVFEDGKPLRPDGDGAYRIRNHGEPFRLELLFEDGSTLD